MRARARVRIRARLMLLAPGYAYPAYPAYYGPSYYPGYYPYAYGPSFKGVVIGRGYGLWFWLPPLVRLDSGR